MATVTFMPAGTYQPGSHNFGPLNVPQAVSNAVISFDRTNWLDPASTLALTIDLSLDGGVTWNMQPEAAQFPVGIEAVGGIALDKNGNPYTASSISTAVPQPGTTDRQIRGNLTIAGAAASISGTLITS